MRNESLFKGRNWFIMDTLFFLIHSLYYYLNMSISTSEKCSLENKRCQEMLSEAVEKNEKIHKLIDSIQDLGCTIPKNFFSCR